MNTRKLLCIGGCCDGSTVEVNLANVRFPVAVQNLLHSRYGPDSSVKRDYYREGTLHIDDCTFTVLICEPMTTAEAITKLLKGYER